MFIGSALCAAELESNMPSTALNIGAKYNLGRGVIATVTGRCKVGYTATQEYKGMVHSIIIPDSKIGNPHYTIKPV